MQNTRTLLTTTCLTAALLCLPLTASANPQGGTVAAGQATISEVGKKLDIHQQSNKAVIDWRGFDIAPDEHTQFHQPDSSAVALNRVNSSSASQINGKLTANGNVVVVNQNGVMFGRNAQVDVNGLVATTADIDNDKFMNNATLAFDKKGKPDAAIVNQGTITAKEAGLVGFVAPNVVNDGVITANLGRVQLASGDTATVDMYGDGLMQVAVSDDVKSQLVANTGVIEADGGKIALTAAAGKDIVNSLIVSKGVLKAQSVGVKNGEIIIAAAGSNKTNKQGNSHVLVEGIVDASGRKAGERGGKITVVGDNVALLDGTFIDASGHTGKSGTTTGKKISDAREGSAGGDIKIGGDYLGGGDTQTAKNLYVDAGVLVLNDSLHEGDAGRMIFWSDDTTEFYGNVYARALGGLAPSASNWHAMAGGNAGNGGFVETSGKKHLDAGGYVNLTASNGSRGTYFLDPTDITIFGTTTSSFGPGVNFNSSAGASVAVNLTNDLELWLDATDASTINCGGACTDGASVQGWTDKSTSTATNSASQSTAGNRPTYNSSDAGFNNRPTIEFGSDKWLDGAADIDRTQGITLFVTAERIAATGFSFTLGSGAGTRLGLRDNQINGGGAFDVGNNLGSIRSIYPGNVIDAFRYSGGALYERTANGTSITSNSTSLVAPLTVNYDVGTLDNRTDIEYNSGGIGEILVFNRTLTANERDLMLQYQSAKWGIALDPVAGAGTEVSEATGSTGYSVFSSRYLERLSQSADISLQATNNISLDLQGDTLNFATSGRSLTLTAGNQINTASAGTITTNNGAISFNATNGIAFSHAIGLNSNGGNITFNNAVTSSVAQDWNAGTGNLTFNSTYTGTSGNLALSAAQMDINNTINVGTNTLTLKPTTAKAIRVGRSTDNGDDATYLDISAPELARLQAGTVSIGDAALASATTIAGNVNTTGATGAAGVYNLNFNTGGTFDSSGYTVNLGRDTVWLDGANDMVTPLGGVADHSFIQNTGVFTLSAWVYWTGSGEDGIISNLITGSEKGFYLSYNNGAANLAVTNGTGALAFVATTAGSLTANTWNLVTYTGDGTTVRSYVNGVANNTGAIGTLSTGNSTRSTILGAFNANTPSGYFAGGIDDVRIYNTTLDAAGVSAIYNSGAGAAMVAGTSGLSGGFAFSEGTGTSAADTSGTVADATLTSGPTWRRAQNLTVNAGGAVTMGNTYGDGSDISITGSAVTLAGKVAAMGNGTLNIASTNDITINNNASANAGGTGNSLVLRSSTGNFINNFNSTALSAANGRWIVYSKNAASNTAGGLTAPQTINGQTYGTLAPSAITGPTYNASQNTWVYSDAAAGGTLRFTANNFSRYYGNTNPSFTYSFWCSTGCTEASAVTGAPTLTTSATQGSDVSTYAISIAQGTLALAGAFSGYTFDFVNGLLTVDPRVVTAALQGTVSKTYNRSTAATLASGNYTLSNVYNSDDVVLNNPTSGTYDTMNVGTNKTVSVSGLSLSGTKATNYTLASTSASGAIGEIIAKALTISGLSGVNKVYDRSTTATLSGTGSLVGVESGDSVTLGGSYSANFGDWDVGNNKAIAVSGYSINNSNYSLTQPTGLTANITAKALTISGLSGVNKVYDRSTTATLSGTGSLVGVESGDTVTLGGTYAANFGDWDVGNNKAIAVSGYSINNSNYSLTQPTGLNANITPKTLTAGLTLSISKTYNGDNFASLSTGNYTLTGAIAGDTVALNSPAIGTYDNKNAGTGKTVTVTGLSLVGGSAGNYQLASTSTSGALGTILAKTLSILGITAQNKVYDGTTTATVNAGSATFSGQVSGDDVSLNSGALSASFLDKNAGDNKAISVSGFSLTGADATNYSLDTASFAGTTANITQRSLAITADAKTKTYGAADPTFTYSYGALATGDTSSIFSGALNRASGNNVGNYAIGLGNLSAGGNYTINYTGANLTINTANLTILANDATRVQGTPNPTFSASYSGFQYADDASVLDGLTISSAASANAFSGDYSIIPSGAFASNYTIDYINGVLTVTPVVIPNTVNIVSQIPAVSVSVNNGAPLSSFATPPSKNAPAINFDAPDKDKELSPSAGSSSSESEPSVETKETLRRIYEEAQKSDENLPILTIDPSLARKFNLN